MDPERKSKKNGRKRSVGTDARTGRRINLSAHTKRRQNAFFFVYPAEQERLTEPGQPSLLPSFIKLLQDKIPEAERQAKRQVSTIDAVRAKLPELEEDIQQKAGSKAQTAENGIEKQTERESFLHENLLYTSASDGI